MRAQERATYLFKLADLIDAKAGALAELETRNNGKPLRDTLGEMRRAVAAHRRAVSRLR